MTEQEKILNLQLEQERINKEYKEKISDLQQSYKKSNRFAIEHHTYDVDDCSSETYSIINTLKERFPNLESAEKYLNTLGYHYNNKGEYHKSHKPMISKRCGTNYNDYMTIIVD